MKKYRTPIIVLISIVLTFFATTLFYLTVPGGYVFGKICDASGQKGMGKLLQIDRLIKNEYTGNYSSAALIDSALHSYVARLNDPYSQYFNQNEYEYFTDSLEGNYKGIGITVENKDGEIYITNVLSPSPASQSGLLPGDVLLKVNGKEYKGSQYSEAVSEIKKLKSDESVLLTVKRGADIFDVSVTIGQIHQNLVQSKMINDIGYIRLNTFGTKAGEEFITEAEKLKKENMKYLIIDLRSNPGGTLDSAVMIADYLLGEGKIVSIKEKSGKETVYKSDEKEISLPMAVLINEESASASEVLSGALKDHHKAVLVGKKTFGKGVVQSVYDLGDKSSLRLTTAKYYTPSGNCIHKIGIKPDIESDFPNDGNISQFGDEKNDTQLLAAINALKK